MAFVNDGGLAELIAEFAADEKALAEGEGEAQEDQVDDFEAWYAAYNEEDDEDEDEDEDDARPAVTEGYSAFTVRSSKPPVVQ